MTWFIEASRPTIATINSYLDGRAPPTIAPIVSRSPFDDQTKNKLSKVVSVFPHDDGFAQHMLLDQRGYLLLSEDALAVLNRFQSEGWEALPMETKSAVSEGAEGLVGDNYYLLNLYLHRDLVDIDSGNIQPRILDEGQTFETTVYWLDVDHRKVAIRKDLIGDISLWLGEGAVLGNIYFVADPLKEAWCALGVNPAVFEPCIDF